MIRLALLGATGRMGTRVLELLKADERFALVAALTSGGDARLGEAVVAGTQTVTIADRCDAAFDVLVDFSVPAGTMQWLDRCVERRAAMVIGATGYTAEQMARIDRAAERIAILQSSNFSVGVALLRSLVKETTRTIGAKSDIEIIEHHHNQKVDAPSGTANTLTEDIGETLGRDVERDVVHGRTGDVGPRPQGQIGVHSVRMGSIVGRHEVHFATVDETITLIHSAHSRDVFARGALDAAAWIAGRGPGRYTMDDMLSARASPRARE
ncbi:MAG: 4-hydroxy-tetrahydrodipicolinate reductase [Phycisphaerales bacterium]|nr:4-hydroxy-tetrahydrodipicolinate reductase [Phycisphaerales bacterium]